MSEVKRSPELHTKHRERMKERVSRNGLESLAEHEALEYLLFFSIPRKDTNELAHQLIQHFGGFCAVLEASEEDLCEVPGIGPASAKLIHSILEFNRYYSIKKKTKKGRVYLTTIPDMFGYALGLLLGKTNEIFYIIALDDQSCVIKDIQVAEGTGNRVSFNKRLMMRELIKCNATCAIMMHNHPMGVAVPSTEDIRTTREVLELLDRIGVSLLDHIIVAGEDCCSLVGTGRFSLY